MLRGWPVENRGCSWLCGTRVSSPKIRYSKISVIQYAHSFPYACSSLYDDPMLIIIQPLLYLLCCCRSQCLQPSHCVRYWEGVQPGLREGSVRSSMYIFLMILVTFPDPQFNRTTSRLYIGSLVSTKLLRAEDVSSRWAKEQWTSRKCSDDVSSDFWLSEFDLRATVPC
jgi:hypothetical protein